MVYTNITRYFSERLWCLMPTVIESFVKYLRSGVKSVSEREIDEHRVMGQMGRYERLKQVFAVEEIWEGIVEMRIEGSMMMRGGIDANCMYIYSYLDFAYMMDRFREDDAVKAVVLVMDSPGGSVSGIAEASESIRKYLERGKKLYVYAEGLLCSAAYWLASYANEIIATPSAAIGSIGVYLIHLSMEKHLDKEGFEVTIIQAGKYKTEGNPYQTLSDETVKKYQDDVDAIYKKFLESVANNRKLSLNSSHTWAEGNVFDDGITAYQLGLIDGYATYTEMITRIKTQNQKTMQKIEEVSGTNVTATESVVSGSSDVTNVTTVANATNVTSVTDVSKAGEGMSVANVVDVEAYERRIREQAEQIERYKQEVSELTEKVSALQALLLEVEEKEMQSRYELLMKENVNRVNAAQRAVFDEMFSKAESKESVLATIKSLVNVLPDTVALLEKPVLGNPEKVSIKGIGNTEQAKSEIVELANKGLTQTKK